MSKKPRTLYYLPDPDNGSVAIQTHQMSKSDEIELQSDGSYTLESPNVGIPERLWATPNEAVTGFVEELEDEIEELNDETRRLKELLEQAWGLLSKGH